MKTRQGRDPSKFALIVFVALVIFCIAQLSWWIVFQIRHTGDHTDTQLSIYKLHIDQIVNTTNNDYQNRISLASEARVLSLGDNRKLEEALGNLIEDPIVSGFSIADSLGSIISAGSLDSTFYGEFAEGCIVYLNRDHPQNLIPAEYSEDIIFTADGVHDGDKSRWVTAEMLHVSEAAYERLETESRKHITMFLSEGAFFVLLILVGAYLIYRALQRSEDLKFRQQHFLQAVTHEFRAPLTSLRLYLEALQSGNVDEKLAAELFPKMLDDCERLDGLIDNVLEAGHFGKSGYELNLSETDLSDDLNEYLDGLEPLVTRLNGDMHRSIENKVMVRSDYQALRRVIRALVDNALRYAPQENRKIEVSLKKADASAEIRVADNGIGISKDEQAKIFDRFYRVSDNYARGVTGTGLGLFLAREIIEAHGGDITVESEGRDNGSTFIITLPLKG